MEHDTPKQRVGDVVRSSVGSAGDDIDQAAYAIEQQAGWEHIGRLKDAHTHLAAAKLHTDAALEAIGPDPSAKTTPAQLEAYEDKLQTLTDDELKAELADATSAVDHEPHATIAIGAITMEQSRREGLRSRLR